MLRELSEITTSEGFVVTAKTHEPLTQEFWFGPGLVSIRSDLQCFPDLDSACSSLQELKTRRKRDDFYRIGLGQVNLRLYPDSHVRELENAKKIIVIGETDLGLELMGVSVENVPSLGHIPASDLLQNGIRPFPNFERALYVLRETRRQGGMPACLANFDFKRINVRLEERVLNQ